MSTSIAIIGAGIAGLSCASALSAAGHSVVVFDKARGPGGRLCTCRGDDWQADHGAQYFTARDALFQREVARWVDSGAVAAWQVTPAVLGSERKPLPEAPLRYVGVPGMSALGKALATGLDVRTGHTIQEPIRGADGWHLSSVEHGALGGAFSQVIVAAPAPQAAVLLAQAAPALSTLAAAQSMEPCWTVVAQSAEPAQFGFGAAFVNAGPLRWMARNNSKPGRSGQDCWVLQANAQWSAEHIEHDAADVAAALLSAFRKLGGPAAVAVRTHRWRYANCETEQIGSAWDAELGIGLCGDWLQGGRVEGAWLSGRALAHRMLECELAMRSPSRPDRR
ncbi:FAD-dependent oxidoreductase [Massilia sp. SR12]